MCKKIHRGGNAEQYHANKKYKEAVAVAVEAYDGATLDDLREAVATLVEIEPIARRVLGTENPVTRVIEHLLQKACATLRARETPKP